MNRRGFLRLLGMGAAAAVAPTKAYSFLGNIMRPRPTWSEGDDLELTVANYGGFDMVPNRDYRIEIHEGKLWIICTTIDPNSKSTITFA